MYDVSQTFIDNSRKQGRQIDVLLSWNGNVPSGDDVLKIDKTFDGDFYRTIMQQIEGEIVGRYDLTGQTINVQVGISYDGSPFEYVDWGEFLVKEHERIIGSSPEYDRTTFKAYDKLLLSHNLYDVNELGITFPISIFNLYEAIANYLGLESSETSIVNGEKMITEDKWTNIEDVTYRNILDEISAVSGSSIMIHDGKLLCKYVDLETPLDTIDENNVKTIKIGDLLKPVNMLNLTREQAHDNYVLPVDWEDIPVNDRSEIVIADNQIMDKDREAYAPDLLSAIEGLSYNTFETSGYGLYHIQPLDVVNVIDMSGNEHISVITSGRMVPTVGNVEELKSAIPGMTREKYALVTDNRRNFMRVYFLVDQQNGMIQGLVEKTEQLDDQLVEQGTSLNLLNDQVNVEVTQRLTSAEGTIENINETISTVESTQQTFTNRITTLEGDMTEQQTFFRTEIDGLFIGGTDWETVMKADGEKISFVNQTGGVQAHFGANGMYVNRWELDYHTIEKFEEGNVRGTIFKNRRSGS